MISVITSPSRTTPTQTDHIYTLGSTSSGSTNYKFVVDVYMNPYEAYAQKVARIKISPNAYGTGIFDVRDIIYNYIEPNPRVDDADNYIEYNGTQFTLSDWQNRTGLIPFVSGFSSSNAWNYNNPYETLQHTGSYRLVLGEEYTSGSTTILNIPTNYYVPPFAMTYTLQSAAVSYSGSPTRIVIENSNGWSGSVSPNIYSAFTSGWTYEHYTSAGSLVASGLSYDDFYFQAALAPSMNDVVYIYQNDSGCGFEFIWGCFGCEATGWNYVDDFCNESPSINESPNSIFIWPAASPSTNLNIYGENSLNQLAYADAVYYYKTSSTTINQNFLNDVYDPIGNGIGLPQFMQMKGNDYSQFNTSGITLSQNKGFNSFHRRTHHRFCPLILSFFNGTYGVNSAQKTSLVELIQTGNTLNYYQNYPLQYTGTTSNSAYTSPDLALQNFTKFVWGAEFSAATKLAYYTTTGASGLTTPTNFTGVGSSEILVFELYGGGCDDDPLHFLYLNSNGVWDTITYNRKNIRSFNNKKDIYAKSQIVSASQYKLQSYQQRNVVYNQDTIISVEAQSDFVDENDAIRFRDLTLSPYVYLMEGMGNIQPTLNTLQLGLIPIEITSASVEDYKARYNKLFQFDITFNYNTIRQFNNQI